METQGRRIVESRLGGYTHGTKEATIDELWTLLRRARDGCGWVNRACGAYVTEIELTPELAARMVHHLDTNNVRRHSPDQIAEIRHDQEHGRYRDPVAPIAIAGSMCEEDVPARDWYMPDGQTRCMAHALSGIAARTLIHFSTKPYQVEGMDRGRRRTIAATHGVPPDAAAVVNAMLRLHRRCKTVPREQTQRYYQKWRAEIDWVRHELDKRRHLHCNSAFFAAAFVWAYLASSAPDEVSDLLVDLTQGDQSFPASRALASRSIQLRRDGAHPGNWEWCRKQMLCVMRVIQLHLHDPETEFPVGYERPELLEHWPLPVDKD